MSNSPVIHFISDLHLSEDQPHLLNLLTHYMTNLAPQSNQLFVLGDLFELWIGDDHQTEFNQQVIQLFADYQGDLFVGHGNRDFLLGQTFANSVAGQLLPEPYHFNWQGKKICLMHGDSLCTDDIAYQQLRTMVRNPEWQRQFLSQSVEQRLAFAANVQAQSKSEQQDKTAEIMDVNQDAVTDTFKTSQCDWLIHGHTHRPDSHSIKLAENNTGWRVVLSDWNDKGQYLELKEGQFQSHYFTC